MVKYVSWILWVGGLSLDKLKNTPKKVTLAQKITQPYSEVTIMNSFDKAGYLLGGELSNLKSPTFTGRWHCGTALVSSGPKTQQSHHNHGGGGGDGGDGA